MESRRMFGLLNKSTDWNPRSAEVSPRRNFDQIGSLHGNENVNFTYWSDWVQYLGLCRGLFLTTNVLITSSSQTNSSSTSLPPDNHRPKDGSKLLRQFTSFYGVHLFVAMLFNNDIPCIRWCQRVQLMFWRLFLELICPQNLIAGRAIDISNILSECAPWMSFLFWVFKALGLMWVLVCKMVEGAL